METIKSTITMEDGGKILLELYPEVAPQSVRNFVYLVRKGFYDGLVFHRIMKGFMIQGGQGKSGSPPLEPIKGEFSSNGVDNPLKHVRGTISMARTNDPDSATSQFFICDSDGQNVKALDGRYAAFGTVISGMEVVDEIAKTPVTDNNGTVLEKNQPVIKSIRVKD